MKRNLAVILPLMFSSHAFAGNYYNWTLDDTTKLASQLEFPMTFKVTPDNHGFYFSYLIITQSSNNAMYTGFQPSPPSADHPGKHMFQLIFSNFYNDTIDFDTSHCHVGADGGNGISCSATYPLDLNKRYAMKITAEKGENSTKYTGILTEPDSGSELTPVGSFTVPNNTDGGLFVPYNSGFIEKYDPEGCDQNITAIQNEVLGIQNGNHVKGYTYSYLLDPDPCFEISVSPTGEDRNQEIVIKPAAKK